MGKIFDYTDYRVFLRSWLEESKKTRPYLSYRFLATRLGLNAGFLAKVFNGSMHLAIKHADVFADFIKLEGREREYFIELLHFGHAKSEKESQERFEKLQLIKGMDFRIVSDDAEEFYRDWWHFPMRTLLGIYPFKGKNYKTLGARLSPPVSEEVARQSVTLLMRLGMVKVDLDGFYRATEDFISTGKGWKTKSIPHFQKEMIRLGENSLDYHPKNIRDVSTVTLPFNRSQIALLKDRIREFRQELLKMSQEVEQDDTVFQLNLQLFPVGMIVSGEGETG